MANLAKFTIEGTASSPGGYDATISQVLNFALEGGPANLVQRWTLQVFSSSESDSPLASKNAPTLTLVGATSGQKVDAATPASEITCTMPGSGVHSWLVRSIVNGGVDASGKKNPDYVFERLVAIKTGSGIRKVIATEQTAYSPRGWSDAQNDLTDAGAGPLTAPGGAGDANKLAAANGSGTNLAYAAAILLASAGTALAFGTNPPTASAYLRLGQTDAGTYAIAQRNNGNTANITLIGALSDDVVRVGDATNSPELHLRSLNNLQLFLGAAQRFIFDRTGGGANEPRLQFSSAGSSPAAWLEYMTDTTATETTRRNFTISAQRKTGNTSTIGGTLSLRGGDASGAGGTHIGGDVVVSAGWAIGASGTRNGGHAALGGGAGITTYGNIFLGTDFSTSINWQSMGRGIYVQNRISEPTADLSDGHAYYSESGRPKWHFNSTKFRLDGTAAGATAGAGGALPATVEGYMTVQINGTTRKMPYYAN